MPDNGINKYERLSQLIQKMLTGNLTEDEFQVLDQMLSDDPEYLKYYIEYTTLWALLDETECLANTDSLPEYNTMTAQVRKEQMPTLKAQPQFIPTVEKGGHSMVVRIIPSAILHLGRNRSKRDAHIVKAS